MALLLREQAARAAPWLRGGAVAPRESRPVFANSSQVAPVAGRAWGIVIGTVVVIATPAMLVSAKTVQAFLPLLLLVIGAGAIYRGRSSILIPSLNAATAFTGALFFYALASVFWADKPGSALPLVIAGIVIAWGSIVTMQALEKESYANVLHIAEGLWIGFLVGLTYAFVEVVSDQAIKIWVYNALKLGPEQLEPDRYFTWEGKSLVAVHPDDLKRNLMPVPLLLWPALIASKTIVSRLWRHGVMALFVGMAFAAVFLSTSYTCKLALVASLVAYLFALYHPRSARVGLTLAWLVACFAVVPIVIQLRAMDLQSADWLQLSGQLRIVIWNEIAHLVANAPILGVGADMTYFTQPPLHEVPPGAQLWLGFPIPHPHNVYLQTWYELGLVGVVLLAGLGSAILTQIANVSPTARPCLYAVFAAAAVEIGVSYNFWQLWFLCLFGFTAAMCLLAVNLAGSPCCRSLEK